MKTLKEAGAAIEATNAKINDLDAKIDKLINAFMINTGPRGHEAAEVDDPNDGGFAEIVEDVSGDPVIKQEVTSVLGRPISAEQAANLAFDQEMLEIQIHDTTEPNPLPYFPVGVDGKTMYFSYGRKYRCQRMFVEGLARAKPVHYGNEEVFQPNGDRTVRNPRRRGLRYPFVVLHDPSGDKGKAWLDSVLKQP